MSTIIIKCANCGTNTEKPVKEIARQKRNGRSDFYCDRSCAVSFTNSNRIGVISRPFTIEDQAKIAMRREGWKYIELIALLKRKRLPFEFEVPLGEFVCDLLLPTFDVIIEFDGVDHRRKDTRRKDKLRDRFVRSQGYRVVRFPVDTNVVIPASVIRHYVGVLSSYEEYKRRRQG